MKVDNSDIKQKIRIRNRVFNYPVSLEKCIEFFAGEGEMTKRFWSKVCKEVITIDEKSNDNILHVGDNKSFIYLSKQIEIIDCDAYGLVLDFIKKIREVCECEKQIIFFTDGTPKKNKKLYKKIDFENEILKLSPTDYYYEKAFGANVYYGLLYFQNNVQNNIQPKNSHIICRTSYI